MGWATKNPAWRPFLMHIPSRAFLAFLLGTFVGLMPLIALGNGLLWGADHLPLSVLHPWGYWLAHLIPSSKQ